MTDERAVLISNYRQRETMVKQYELSDKGMNRRRALGVAGRFPDPQRYPDVGASSCSQGFGCGKISGQPTSTHASL